MIARRKLLGGVLAGATIAASRTFAAPAGPPVRVGVLGLGPFDQSLDAQFKDGLKASGYTDGVNLALVYRDGAGRSEPLPALAAELTGMNVAVILARGPAALAAAQAATKATPIVALDLESDPIAMGYATSLARPGRNVTGVFLDVPELSGKQLELLKEALPRFSRVAVVGDPALNASQMAATRQAARTFAIELTALDARVEEDFERVFNAAQAARADAVLLLSSPLVFNMRSQITDLAMARGIPAVSLFVEFAEAGGLMAYGPSLGVSYRRCGGYAGRILQGATAGELPIERPEKFDLTINLKTAKALGLTIPPTLVARADAVIE